MHTMVKCLQVVVEKSILNNLYICYILWIEIKKRDIIVWDSQTYEQKFQLLGHDLIVNCVRFSKNSKRLYSSSGDKYLYFYDIFLIVKLCYLNR